MHAGMVNSVTSAADQRRLADVLLKPPLANVDLLHWHAFDRAIEAGYSYARSALESLPQVPRLPAAVDRPQRSSLAAELERRLGVRETGSAQGPRPIRVPPG
jgi:NTE family protein